MFKLLPLNKSLKYILAHSIIADGKKIRKGTMLSKKDLVALKKAGFKEIYVFKTSLNDIKENDAANKIARYLSDNNVVCKKAVNGRADLYSKVNGMVCFDKKKLISVNFKNIDIAISMLKAESIVKKNQLIGNIKILPYAINKKKLKRILGNESLFKFINVKKNQLNKIALIISGNNLNKKIENKVIDAINIRLKEFNIKLYKVLYSKHTTDSLKSNINLIKKYNIELALIYGSTSIIDINDIIPKSIKALNGKIISFGLPTDPGNLLLFGELNNIKIIGVPGCAKSLIRNGFDLVLEKVCFGLKVNKKVIAEMSNGGLFKTQIKK